MELWIRSQDRERLMKASDLRIAYVKEKDKWVVEDCDNLGYYSTRKRALEVLDEIEKMMRLNLTTNGTYQQNDLTIKGNILGFMVKIYEMPKE